MEHNQRRSAFAAQMGDILTLVWMAVILLCMLIMPAACAAAEAWTHEEQALWDAYCRGEVVRLHVLADSNSPRDQAVKLAVRDALLHCFGDELRQAGCTGSDEAYRLLCSNTDCFEAVARDCARRCGFVGEVRAEAGVMYLPPKTYGNVTLPEGEYRALRVTIGSGKGRNWWCVLFPQLCLAAAEDGQGEGVVWNRERIWQQWLLSSPHTAVALPQDVL